MSLPVNTKIPTAVSYADAVLVLKQNRITAVASENNLPLIALVQSVSGSTLSAAFVSLIIIRLESFYLNNSVSSIKVVRYSVTLL